MDEQGIYVEIMKKLQRKYGSLNEIQKTTQEMQEALSRNDRVSMEMLISMRQELSLRLIVTGISVTCYPYLSRIKESGSEDG